MTITRSQTDIQTQYIYKLLLECKTEEQIARELNISTRTVQRYLQRIYKQYGNIQRQKTEDTIYLECKLFKERLLDLFIDLKSVVKDSKRSGGERAKCAEVATNIAIDILKVESEGVKAILNEGLIKYNGNLVTKAQRLLDDSEPEDPTNPEPERSDPSIIESDSNRKF